MCLCGNSQPQSWSELSSTIMEEQYSSFEEIMNSLTEGMEDIEAFMRKLTTTELSRSEQQDTNYIPL